MSFSEICTGCSYVSISSSIPCIFLVKKLERCRNIFCNVNVIFSCVNKFFLIFCPFSLAFKKFDAVLSMAEDEPILSKRRYSFPEVYFNSHFSLHLVHNLNNQIFLIFFSQPFVVCFFFFFQSCIKRLIIFSCFSCISLTSLSGVSCSIFSISLSLSSSYTTILCFCGFCFFITVFCCLYSFFLFLVIYSLECLFPFTPF